MPHFNANFDFIPVSREFIEKYMPPANGAYVKIYLMALSLGFEGVSMSTAEMARVLNLLESDVVNALEFWKSEGVLSYDKDNVLFGGAAPSPEKKQDADFPKKKDIKQILICNLENLQNN